MRQITVLNQLRAVRHLLLPIGLACLFVFSLAAAHQASAASDIKPSEGHLLTVYDGDFEKTFVTTENTVEKALKSEGIALEAADHVEPMAKTELVAGSYSVNIYRARPVTVIDGAKKTLVLTSSQNPKKIVEQAGDKLYDEDLTQYQQATDPLESGGVGLNLVIDRATTFKFTFYGNTFTARTQAETVGQMLEEKEISLGKNDGVSLPLDTKIRSGMVIKVWRDGKQTITVEEAIERPIEEIQDADREIGYRKVKTPGQDGKAKVTYEIVTKDGVEVKRKKISSVTVSKPVKEVVIVGAKSNYSGSLEEWLLALRTCETHGNYQTNTGNGFYGAYQFMPSTWDNIARMSGRNDLVGVMPHRASPADQDAMVIANTNATAGLSTQHPGCYAKLGLSNKPPQ